MSKRTKKQKSSVPPLDLDQLEEQLTAEINSSIVLYLTNVEYEDDFEAIEELLQFHPELPELFQLRRQVGMLQGQMADGAR